MVARSTQVAVGVSVLVLVLLAVAVFGVFSLLQGRNLSTPVPGQQRCVATAGGHSVAVDLNQAHYASIIAGLTLKRDLPPRAASIALATVYQETGIRNLDYGDRDSVGLFQQRPSQGWGTQQQLMNPYYATGEFYSALVKVPNWRTRDITEVAQRVQRSAYPDAYRDHEADARVLASTLTGRSPAGFSCLDRSGNPGKPGPLIRDLRRTFGAVATEKSGRTIRIEAGSETAAWAYGSFAVANTRTYGVSSVTVGDREWRNDPVELATWTAAKQPVDASTVVITLRD